MCYKDTPAVTLNARGWKWPRLCWWSMVLAVSTGQLWRGVRSLDGRFDRPKSHGTLCWGRAVKQIGKQMVSFWSVER